MLLVIDNYDSFTYNLVQFFGELGAEMKVFRNDEITVEGIREIAPDRICISPGPCTPMEAGVSCETIRELGASVPILGVCLGHQAIGQVYGGEVVRADKLMHGKTSMIEHDGRGVFGESTTRSRRPAITPSSSGVSPCLSASRQRPGAMAS